VVCAINVGIVAMTIRGASNFVQDMFSCNKEIIIDLTELRGCIEGWYAFRRYIVPKIAIHHTRARIQFI
jgi:hypothetical protein